MPAYQLEIEFDVTRRIGWTDEDLGEHIDDVFERLHQAHGVDGLDASADLDTGRSTVTLRFRAERDEQPERVGKTALGVAIRSSGGSHNGLLSFSEEAKLEPHRGKWSGLRTPSWNVRQVGLVEVPTSA